MSETVSPPQPVFNIEKLYVKDLSLEIPHAPAIFLERDQPQVDLQLNTQSSVVSDGMYEVTITVTVTSRLVAKNQIMFLIEAKQAGIFQLRNLPQEELAPVLGVVCPNILYPYLREVVSDLAVRAGFAPVLLNPINFEVLYQQQQQQAAPEAVTTH
ncbi:MAG: protein-export chaperone SecB [Pseudomonadota bacterium]